MRVEHKTEDGVKNGSEQERLPGQIEINIPGLKANDSVRTGIQKSNSQGLINKLHDEGKHIVAKTRPGGLIYYVAISTALIGVIAGGVYLRRRKK